MLDYTADTCVVLKAESPTFIPIHPPKPGVHQNHIATRPNQTLSAPPTFRRRRPHKWVAQLEMPPCSNTVRHFFIHSFNKLGRPRTRSPDKCTANEVAVFEERKSKQMSAQHKTDRSLRPQCDENDRQGLTTGRQPPRFTFHGTAEQSAARYSSWPSDCVHLN